MSDSYILFVTKTTVIFVVFFPIKMEPARPWVNVSYAICEEQSREPSSVVRHQDSMIAECLSLNLLLVFISDSELVVLRRALRKTLKSDVF